MGVPRGQELTVRYEDEGVEGQEKEETGKIIRTNKSQKYFNSIFHIRISECDNTYEEELTLYKKRRI